MRRQTSGAGGLVRTPAVSKLRVEAVTDYQGLLALEPAWNALLERAGVDHPFLEFDWVRTWWECFGGGKKPYVLVAWDGDEPVAIAPLLRSCQRTYGLKLRQLEFFQNDHTGRFDFLMPRPDAEIYRAVWKHLAKSKEVWDVVKLCQVPAGSATLDHWTAMARSDGFLTGVWRSANSPYIALNHGWENYMAGLRRGHRQELRRRERRLEAFGALTFDVLASNDAREALPEAAAMQAAAWTTKETGGIGRPADVRRFYARLAERTAARGWLHLHLLKLNGKPIAFGFALEYKNRLYLLRAGSDPQYASLFPYSVLFSKVLRWSFDRGLAEIDLLGEDDRAKLQWTGEARPHYWLFVFQRGLRSSVLHHARFRLAPWLQRRLSHAPAAPDGRAPAA